MLQGAVRLMLVNSPAIAFLVLFTLLLQGTANASSQVAKGGWAGEHIVVEVSEKSAEIEFDCARGQVTQPMTLDKHGDFDVIGTFTREHGGPVRRDENPPSTPARYSGHIDGNSMSITVTLGQENVGTFALTRGASPHLTKCR